MNVKSGKWLTPPNVTGINIYKRLHIFNKFTHKNILLAISSQLNQVSNSFI